jgi:rubrerythrin
MEKKLQVQELIDLCGLDIDAARCYRTAVSNIEVYEIRETVSGFLSQHNRHVSELSTLIRRMDGIPPIDMPSGSFISDKLHMIAGTERTAETIRDMRDNEKIINQLYAEAALLELGKEASELVARAYAEEKGHLEYLEHALRERIWERVPVTPMGT